MSEALAPPRFAGMTSAVGSWSLKHHGSSFQMLRIVHHDGGEHELSVEWKGRVVDT